MHQLTLAWAFQTNQPQQIKATPIRQRRDLHHHARQPVGDRRALGPADLALHYPANEGFHIGHRGVAVYKDFVYLTTPDAHLVALDARDGKVRWNVEIADARRGFWSTNAPPRAQPPARRRGRRLRQPAGTLKSFDPETGKVQWTFYSTPPPGTPGSESGATGGQMWMTGTYDPELNLVFVGTGNPTPVLNEPHARRQPVDLQHRRAQSRHRKLVWGFQASPHDTHDWDAAEVPVLVDATFNGAPAAAAGVAQRLLLRARSHHRQESRDDAVYDGELGEGDRQGRPARARSGKRTGA